MIRRVTIKNFKRYENVEFLLEGPVVLAGPNNMGKTTALQAIAAWNLALNRWKQLNNFQRRGGAYPLAPIARQAFLPVPLKNFEWLWNRRRYQGHYIQIEVQSTLGWTITMEFRPDSTEQIYVHPLPTADPDVLRAAEINATYVPPMSGLQVDEPVYNRPKQDQLLGQGRPGEIIRNLLLEASQTEQVWIALTEAIVRLFRCQLLVPDGSGADILCEYQPIGTEMLLDISAAGSGMQQVLMLLAFLHMRPGSVLLLDEPDAHLHVYLQESIYSELRSVAARRGSQLIIATHSEVIINSVAPEELMLVYNTPRRLVDKVERSRLMKSLRVLSQADVMLGLEAHGVLYCEGHTDLANLKEWARVLNHPLSGWLSTEPFWKPVVTNQRDGVQGVGSKEHYEALQLVRPDITAVQLVDSDGKALGIPQSTAVEMGKLNRLVFERYETESYLVQPAVLARYIDSTIGSGGVAAVHKALTAIFEAYAGKDLGKAIAEAFIADPMNPADIVIRYLKDTKARKDIIPRILSEGGIHGMDYTKYSDIAAVMLPGEVHPEVMEKLDFIQQAFAL